MLIEHNVIIRSMWLQSLLTKLFFTKFNRYKPRIMKGHIRGQQNIYTLIIKLADVLVHTFQ